LELNGIGNEIDLLDVHWNVKINGEQEPVAGVV